MTGNKIIKIFLASSSELKDDREQFEIFINRKNKEYIKQSIFLELIIWEDFLDAMSATRLQDEYNKAITDCDVFVSLFKTKVGQYTEEEFLKALETFRLNQKLLIYTYFKDSQISISQITHEISSLLNFKKRLNDLGHFYKSYKEVEQLKYLFDQQLNKFIPKLITKIEVTSQVEKQESDESWQSQTRQLEQELEQERSHQQQFEGTYQYKISKLVQQLTEEKAHKHQLERSHQSKIEEKESEITRLLEEKEKSKQSLESQIRQLEQNLKEKQQQSLILLDQRQSAQEKIAEQEATIAQLHKQLEQLKSEPKTTTKDKIELKSAKIVDYTKLRNLLATGEWKEADLETAQVMLEAASRQEAGWLREEDIDNFPCEDLRAINQLWLHYSDRKFGFSVQKEIYESLGGTREYNREVWNSFGDRVGWKKEANWLDYDDFIFNLDEAPTAHLPGSVYRIVRLMGGFSLESLVQREFMLGCEEFGLLSGFSSLRVLFSRAKTCTPKV